MRTEIVESGEPTRALTSLGGVLILISLVFLVLPAGTHAKWPVGAAPSAGLLAGVLAGLF